MVLLQVIELDDVNEDDEADVSSPGLSAGEEEEEEDTDEGMEEEETVEDMASLVFSNHES